MIAHCEFCTYYSEQYNECLKKATKTNKLLHQVDTTITLKVVGVCIKEGYKSYIGTCALGGMNADQLASLRQISISRNKYLNKCKQGIKKAKSR